MTASPIWFGREERQLFGWIYLPEGAHAGFVLCPPLGIEASPGYRALTVLAERLEAAGNVVVRFDYTGTGDSAGDTTDVPSVETWTEDIKSAIEMVRSTGVANVGVVGLRVGALLAGYVVPRLSVDALVLWDPCVTGRRFLREQALLGSVVSGAAKVVADAASDAVDIPSLNLPQGLADSLATLDLERETGRFPDEVLVLTRPDRPIGKVLLERLSAVHVECVDATEQYVFFESQTPFMPETAIDHIAAWCIGTFQSLSVNQITPRSPSRVWSSAIVTGSHDNQGVKERPVTIEPGGLFGILTEPITVETPTEQRVLPPPVLLLNLGGDRRTGPSRLWVDLGRSWARKGVRVLRIDLGGLGDSPSRPGDDRYLIFPPGGIDDVISATKFLAPDDPSGVLLMGVCSGAYHVAEAAMALKSKTVWLINPAVPVADAFPSMDDDTFEGSRRRVFRRAGPISQRFSQMAGLVNVVHRLMPDAAWWLLDRLGLYTYRIRAFDPLLEQGTETFLMCGTSESVPYVDRGHRALWDRLRTGRLHLEVVNALDHGLMMSASRREVTRRLDDYVAAQLSDVGNASIP